VSRALFAGRYAIERPLGHGAMAIVELARDVELDRPVALKRLAENLARDGEVRARFLREGRLAARLSDPNVVRIFDVGEEDGRPFIAMEYVDGQTLSQLVRARGPRPAHEAAALGVQLCRGLAAVHRAGLVHRDVTPQNVLLHRDGQLKLGDFGIAFGVEGTRLTIAGTVLGTAAYLAPEQARGDDATAAADIYGAGAVLYELLAGRPPRTPTSVAELAELRPIDPPAGIPPALARIVMRCLEDEPKQRPASAAALAQELASTLPDAQTIALPGRPATRATALLVPGSRSRRRARARTLLAVGAVLAILGGTAAAIVTNTGHSSSSRQRPGVRISPVRPGASAEEQAHNLAAWLKRYSR